MPQKRTFLKDCPTYRPAYHLNYRLYPGNYIACDLLEDTQKFTGQYNAADVTKFETYLQERLELIDLPNKDLPFLRRCILTMYANPVINHLKALHT